MLVSNTLRLAAHQRNRLRQPRRKRGKIRLLARLDPGLVRHDTQHGALAHQILRQLSGPIIKPPRLPRIHRRVAHRIRYQVGCFHGTEEVADFFGGESPVVHAAEQRHLPGAEFRSLIRQMGLLVPSQNGDGSAKHIQLAQFGDQRPVRFGCVHGAGIRPAGRGGVQIRGASRSAPGCQLPQVRCTFSASCPLSMYSGRGSE